jgi:hypothetical protein
VPAAWQVNSLATAWTDGVARQYATRVINGYRVQVGATAKDQWPTSALCASNAGGVFAWIAMGSHSAISPAGLLARHLRLLGPGPANWTSKLIS